MTITIVDFANVVFEFLTDSTRLKGVAGFLGPTFGWRLPFLIVSVPALCCAATVLFTVQDPERGGMEQAFLEMKETMRNTMDENDDHMEFMPTSRTAQKETEMKQLNSTSASDDGNNFNTLTPLSPAGGRRRSNDSQQIKVGEENSCEKGPLRALKSSALQQFYRNAIQPTMKSMRVLLSTPTVTLSFLQGPPGCLPWGIVNTYLNDFLAEDRGMTVEFATFTILCFGIGNSLGLLLGGFCGQYLYSVDKRYPALLAGSTAILGCVPFWVLLNGVDNNTTIIPIATIAVTAGTASGIAGPIIKATLQNVTRPHMRGQAFALFNTFDDFGRGLGPVFVAKLITTIGGRTPAFNLGTAGWIVCGVLNLAIFFTAERDEQRSQAILSTNLNSKRDHAEDALL